MRVLVTGASGFTGSYVAATLARDGFDVTGLYRRAPGFATPYEDIKGLTLLRADLAGIADLTGPFETIIHTAATSPARGVTDADMVRDNSDATRNLVAEAERLGCRRFIYFSSLSIHGDISVPVVDEHTPITNPDTYGATKLRGERMLASRAANLPGIALRLPGIIGKGAHRNWLSGLAAKLRGGDAITAFNLDQPFNNACHVGDLTSLVTGLCHRDWRGFDAVVLGARGAITVRGAIERLAASLGVTADIREVTSPQAGFTLSSARAIERWGYDPMEIGVMIDRYGREI